jgi:hypothetical protein
MFAWSQLDFSAIPVSIYGVSLTSRQTCQNNSKRRLQRIQTVQEGKRHQKKETSSFFCLCSFCFGKKFPTAEFGMISTETSCWEIERKIAKCLMRTFTCRSTFLYVWQTHRFKMAATTRPPTLPKKRAATRSIWKHINTLCTSIYRNKVSFECRRCQNIDSFQFRVRAGDMKINEGSREVIEKRWRK